MQRSWNASVSISEVEMRRTASDSLSETGAWTSRSASHTDLPGTQLPLTLSLSTVSVVLCNTTLYKKDKSAKCYLYLSTSFFVYDFHISNLAIRYDITIYYDMHVCVGL